MMNQHMDPQRINQCEGGAKSLDAVATPVVTAYLMQAVMPVRGKDLSLRNESELTTMAKALDMILRGNVAGEGDVLVQRF